MTDLLYFSGARGEDRYFPGSNGLSLHSRVNRFGREANDVALTQAPGRLPYYPHRLADSLEKVLKACRHASIALRLRSEIKEEPAAARGSVAEKQQPCRKSSGADQYQLIRR